MRYFTVLIAALAFCLSPLMVDASDFKTAFERSRIDMKTVSRLMDKGQLVIIDEKPDGTLELVTAGIIIDAPIDKVWETIKDFEKYPEFMPSTAATKVLKEGKEGTDVRYKIAFKFSVLKWEVEYVLRHTFVDKKELTWTLVNSKNDKIKTTFGKWQLFPGSKKTTLAFYSAYSDIKSISWVIKTALEAEPSMEMAINSSSCVMVLKALKNWVETPKAQEDAPAKSKKQ